MGILRLLYDEELQGSARLLAMEAWFGIVVRSHEALLPVVHSIPNRACDRVAHCLQGRLCACTGSHVMAAGMLAASADVPAVGHMMSSTQQQPDEQLQDGQMDALLGQLAAADIAVSASDSQRKALMEAQAAAAAEMRHCDAELEGVTAHVRALLADIKTERDCGQDIKPLLQSVRPQVCCASRRTRSNFAAPQLLQMWRFHHFIRRFAGALTAISKLH